MLVDARIEALLDQVHAAILTANFPALAKLSPTLEAALAELPADLQHGTLERLRQKAVRNATCAQSAGRGVRAAIRRLDEVQQNQSGLVTYDEKGKRSQRSDRAELTRRL